MKPLRPLPLAWTALLLFVLLVSSWIALSRNRLYSSPTQPRFNREYEKIFTEPIPTPPTPPQNLLQGISIVREPASLQIRFPEALGRDGQDFIQFERLTALSNRVQIDGGSVSLASIAIGYLTNGARFDYSLEVPARFFSSDLTPVSSEEASRSAPRWNRTIDVNGKYPAVEFSFVTTNLPQLKPLDLYVFDARTRATVKSGLSTSSGTNWFRFGTDLRLWHQTPVHVVARFATEPLEIKSLAPKEGAEIRFGPRAVRVLALLNEETAGWNSSSSQGTNHMNFNLREPSGDQPQFTIVLFETPSPYPSPLNLEALDRQGNPMQSAGGGSSGPIRIAEYRGALDQLGEIRLSLFTRPYQVTFTLPEIPGLPEENRNLQNLFDIQIPYMRVRYEHDLQEAVRNLAAMDMIHLSLNYPNGYFPLHFTNTTPAGLLKELETLLPPHRHLAVDPEQNSIRYGMTLWQQLADKAQKVFR